jgi:hypothetical protein
MSHLTPEQKVFVVQHLATDHSNQEVIALLKDVYGVKASSQQISFYNPETTNGDERLSKELEDEFYRAREQYRTQKAYLPITNRNYRLRKLQKILDDPQTGRSPKAVTAVVELYEKIEGGMFQSRANAATPEEVADYVGELVADMRAGIVAAVKDPEQQQRALDEIENRLAKRSQQGGGSGHDAPEGRPAA